MAVNTLLVEDVEHSPLGASSADRWMNCPGSSRLIRSLGEGAKKSGMAAAEGTAAHTVASNCLETNDDAWQHTGKTITVDQWNFDVNDEMTSAVQIYIDYVRELVQKYESLGGVLHVEMRLKSKLHPKAFGTSDTVIYVPCEAIIVVDYKHGKGIVVEPTKEQLKYYAALAYENRPAYMRGKGEPKKVILVIAQPRIPHPKGLVREFITTPKEIEDWFVNEAIPAMNETENPNAILKAGDWCGFCPAREVCPLLQDMVKSVDTSREPNTMSAQEIADAIAKMEIVAKYIEKLQDEMFKRAQNGDKFPGWKLVYKQANRVWKTGGEEAVKEALGDSAYSKPKLLSPAQVEGLPGGKALVTRWACKPVTGLTMAKASDPREEATSAIDKFDDMMEKRLAKGDDL